MSDFLPPQPGSTPGKPGFWPQVIALLLVVIITAWVFIAAVAFGWLTVHCFEWAWKVVGG